MAVAAAALLGAPGVASAEEPTAVERGAGWATDGDPSPAAGQATAQAAPPVAAASSPIAAKYAATGGSAGPLGLGVGVEDCTLTGGGCVQEYEYGEIVWSAATGARALTDPDIFLAWYDAGLEAGSLRYPTSDTFCGLPADGCGQHFQGGSIYWSPPADAAVIVPDSVRRIWSSGGWERGKLGYPLQDQECTLRDGGCLQRFQRGGVYSSPRTPTVAVLNGVVRNRWGAGGWERGWLGYPTRDTFCGLAGGGCGQHFQGGSIYSSPAGAFAVSAGIRDRWAAQGWERGIGLPTSEAFSIGAGTAQHFQRGSIYPTPGAPLLVVPGAFRDAYARQGWERGFLGYPLSGVFCGLKDGGCGQHYTGGSIYSSPAGTFVIPRAIVDEWSKQGYERGGMGYPTSAVFCGLRDGGCGQHFQGGSAYAGGPITNGYRAIVNFVSGPIRDAWAAQGWEQGRLSYPAGAMTVRNGLVSQPFVGGGISVRDGRVSVWYR
ncbi:LGFP repeat-containing protein [Modestobacter sp. SYSU DS0657]